MKSSNTSRYTRRKSILNENIYYNIGKNEVFEGNRNTLAADKARAARHGEDISAELILRRPTDNEIREGFKDVPSEQKPAAIHNAAMTIYSCVLSNFGLIDSIIRGQEFVVSRDMTKKLEKLKSIFANIARLEKNNENLPASDFFERCNGRNMNTTDRLLVVDINDIASKFNNGLNAEYNEEIVELNRLRENMMYEESAESRDAYAEAWATTSKPVKKYFNAELRKDRINPVDLIPELDKEIVISFNKLLYTYTDAELKREWDIYDKKWGDTQAANANRKTFNTGRNRPTGEKKKKRKFNTYADLADYYNNPGRKYKKSWSGLMGQDASLLRSRIREQIYEQYPEIMPFISANDIQAIIDKAFDKVQDCARETAEVLSKEGKDLTPSNMAFEADKSTRNTAVSSFIATMNDPANDIMMLFEPKPEACGGYEGDTFDGTIKEYFKSINEFIDEALENPDMKGNKIDSGEALASMVEPKVQALADTMKSPAAQSKRFPHPGGLASVKNFVNYLSEADARGINKAEYTKTRDAFMTSYGEMVEAENEAKILAKSLSKEEADDLLERRKVPEQMHELARFYDEHPNGVGKIMTFLNELGITKDKLESIETYKEFNELLYSGDNCYKLLYMTGYTPQNKVNRKTIDDRAMYDLKKRHEPLIKKMVELIKNNNTEDDEQFVKLYKKYKEKWNDAYSLGILDNLFDRYSSERLFEISKEYGIKIKTPRSDADVDANTTRSCIVLTVKREKSNTPVERFNSDIDKFSNGIQSELSKYDNYLDVYSFQPADSMTTVKIAVEYDNNSELAELVNSEEGRNKILSDLGKAKKPTSTLKVNIAPADFGTSSMPVINSNAIHSEADGFKEYNDNVPQDIDGDDDAKYRYAYIDKAAHKKVAKKLKTADPRDIEHLNSIFGSTPDDDNSISDDDSDLILSDDNNSNSNTNSDDDSWADDDDDLIL